VVAIAGKVSDAAKGGIRAWLMPEINDIKVQLAEIRGDIKSLQTEVEAVKDSLSVIQRLAVLEAKVSQLEKKER
jgi:hypothetical protein